MKKKLPYIVSIGITLAVGGISALLIKDSFEVYSALEKPAAAPPGAVFPIVWSILYILMAISAAMIYTSDCSSRTALIELYFIQLIVNFIWPIIFFEWQLFLPAFIWLILLWVLVLIMTVLFYMCRKTAGYLLVPYLIWITFAGYLNFSIYLMN
ncbi:MAG: TspO/MBR family protein [Bacillota bacterium]|nr:TspO/MBR family protein [Bacillota bacterium]